MTNGQIVWLLLGLIVIGWLLYRRAKADEVAAQQHLQRVDAANSMIGVAGKVISYIFA